MNPFLAGALGAAGVALLVLATLFRLGRRPWAREWVHGSDQHISSVLLLLPSGAAGLVAFGVVSYADDNALAGLVLLVTLPTFVVLGLWSLVTSRVPLWFLPAWSRDSVRGKRAATRKRR